MLECFFVTPLRIKKDNGYIINDKIDLKDLMNSIYKRKVQISNLKFSGFPYEVRGEIVAKSLEYVEFTRHSNKQDKSMQFGGLVGYIDVRDIDKNCLEMLKLGEIIGAGKQTVFGLGKIRVAGLARESMAD